MDWRTSFGQRQRGVNLLLLGLAAGFGIVKIRIFQRYMWREGGRRYPPHVAAANPRLPLPSSAETFPLRNASPLDVPVVAPTARRLDSPLARVFTRRPAPSISGASHGQLLLPQVTLLDQQLRDVGRRIKHLLKTIEESGDSDVSIIQSVPGIGPGITAIPLSEASRPIRERDYYFLRCLAGTAPVAVQSAKRRMVSMRRACSARLRQALHHWATRSIICDETSRKQYDYLRTAGHQHARALRGLADRLVRMLIAMLKYQTPFDPQTR
jgi:Transposase IS116/IS110/IS902 family